MQVPRVSDILGIIGRIAPPYLAEQWDNPGLQIGNPAGSAARIMTALDADPSTVDAAIENRCSLLVTHHPFIFRPLKRLDLSNPQSAAIARALRHDLAVVSLHTNYDAAAGGLNDLLARLAGVSDVQPLRVSWREELLKLVVYVPATHEEAVLEALFAHAGVIGNYSDCSFRTSGTGTFRPLAGANPFIGSIDQREAVDEVRIEVLVRKQESSRAVRALLKAHPYEEPAYDLFPLQQTGAQLGIGRIGRLPAEESLAEFVARVKESLAVDHVRVVGEAARTIRKVAVCSGSGASFLSDAVRQGADVLLTGDVKYHEAREAQSAGIALVDAGHFATEAIAIQELALRLTEELAQGRYEAEVVPCCIERDPFLIL